MRIFVRMETTAQIPVAFEETDIEKLLQQSLRPLVEQATRSRVDLRIATLGDIPALHVDREKLAWCVATLVGNACRYTSADEDTRGSVVVHVTRLDDANEISVSIQDDGPGIPDAKLPYLFERKTGAAYAEGLGLSLVREIVQAHRGRIEVESRRHEDDHGTSITIVLPVRL